MKSQLAQHLKTALHLRNLERYTARPERQLLLGEVQATGRKEFFVDMCEAFLAADIPWRKLDQPKLRKFLEKYTQNAIPDQSTLRKNYLPRLYSKVSFNWFFRWCHLMLFSVMVVKLVVYGTSCEPCRIICLFSDH